MTVNQGPQRPAPPRYEATRQYKNQLREFEKLIALGGIEAGSIPLIIGGMHLIDIDLVSILETALAAEINDPEPQCGLPIGPRHCVKVWRHKDAHWILEE